MRLQEIIDHLPPREDLARFARYVSGLRRPSRMELIFVGVGGALVGAGIALLFAPSRGSDLRSAIGERLEDYWRASSESLRPNGPAAQER